MGFRVAARTGIARHVSGKESARDLAGIQWAAVAQAAVREYEMNRQTFAPWINRIVLAAATLIFTMIGMRYITNPVHAAAATGATLNTPLAATTTRIGFGAKTSMAPSRRPSRN